MGIQDVQQYAAVTEGVERMMKIIVRFRIVENLSRKASYEASRRLETSLVELYTRLYGVICSRRIAILAGTLPVGDVLNVHPRPDQHKRCV